MIRTPRRLGVRLAALLGAAGCALIVAAGPVAAAPATSAPTSTTPVTSTSPAIGPSASLAASPPATSPVDVGWTDDQAKAAIGSGAIARLPGAVAVFDEAQVRRAIAGTDIHILLLPFQPIDKAVRDAWADQTVNLGVWASDNGISLVTVEGLLVSFSIFRVTPSSLDEMQRVIAPQDVTNDLLFAIANVKDRHHRGDDDASPPLPRTTADPVQVREIGDTMEATGIYNDPALSEPQQLLPSWSKAGPDRTIRAAFLPPIARGAPVPDLVSALHQRFPNDIVVVAFGRWLEVAGPDPTLLHYSLVWVYGYYQSQMLRWDVQPDALVGVLAQRVGLLRTGVASDRATPPRAADPVSTVSRALPWIIAGTVVLLAGAVFTVDRVRRRRERADRRHAEAERNRLAGELALVGARIVDIDSLAPVSDSPAGRQLDKATERYRAARTVLTRHGDPAVIAKALDAAQTALAKAAATLHVPLRDGEVAP